LLLVFSDPACGPCNELAPRLQDLHRQMPGLAVLMVSRGDPAANRAKRAEHGLTFPIVLQRHWEISRRYCRVSGLRRTPLVT
jgi:peroxiredoxin